MFFRLQLPLILTFLAGMIPIVAFFFTDRATVVKWPADHLERWLVIVAGFALLLGVVNVIQGNIKKIERRSSGWPYAIFLLLGLFAFGTAGILSAIGVGAFQGIGMRPDGAHTPFSWGTRYFFEPLQATMFALLAFYVASAAFRAFRVRNLEATILLSAAVLVMLGRIPLGETLLSWIPWGDARSWLGDFTEWMMTKPNAAAQRGIMIGAALGAASLSLRVILGIERSYLGLEKND
jgi:hypothetical protein